MNRVDEQILARWLAGESEEELARAVHLFTWSFTMHLYLYIVGTGQDPKQLRQVRAKAVRELKAVEWRARPNKRGTLDHEACYVRYLNGESLRAIGRSYGVNSDAVRHAVRRVAEGEGLSADRVNELRVATPRAGRPRVLSAAR